MTQTPKLVLIRALAAGIVSLVVTQSREGDRKTFGMVPSNATFADPTRTAQE